MPDIFSNPKELQEDLSHGTLELAYSIHHTKAKSPQILYRHWHEECEFLVVEKGQTNFQIGSKHLTLSAGDAAFIPPYYIHEAISDTDCQFYAIVFQPSFLIGDTSSYLYRKYIYPIYQNVPTCIGQFHGTSSSFPAWEQQITKTLLALCKDHIDTPYDSPLFIKAQLLICWQTFFKQHLKETKIRVDARILDVVTFLQQHFHEDITIAHLSELVHISEGQLSRLFKQQIGTSIITYLNRIRLTHACQLLINSSDSICDIAFSCGFRSLSNFNRLFKKQLLCSPLVCRKKLKIKN